MIKNEEPLEKVIPFKAVNILNPCNPVIRIIRDSKRELNYINAAVAAVILKRVQDDPKG